MLRTSLRSEIQATDSTCNGCSAKSAAAQRLRPFLVPSSAAAEEIAAANSRYGTASLTKCIAPALTPEQLAIQHARQPRNRVPVTGVSRREGPSDRLRVNPARTGGFEVT